MVLKGSEAVLDERPSTQKYQYAANLGWNLDEAMDRVHKSNMSKLDEYGKPVLFRGSHVFLAYLTVKIHSPHKKRYNNSEYG